MRLISSSSRETEDLGHKFARRVLSSKTGRTARVFALVGDLGSGKTTFAKGFLRGLAPRARTASPTFVLIRRVPLKHKKFNQFFHADVYRLKSPKELSRLNFKEVLSNPRHIVLVEWAEKVKKLVPKNSVWIKLEHGKKENERRILISNTKSN